MSGKLSLEDRILWTKVAHSTRPLRGKTLPAPAEPSFAELLGKTLPRQTETLPPGPPPKPRSPALPRHLDEQTRTKLGKGRLPIEGKLDLHGLTQNEAHELLFDFLDRAFRDGRRYVLVVTGKGLSSGGDGVLKRAVPGWLQTALFRPLVSGHDHAARNHGGAGALYVRLRRQEREGS